MYFQGAIPSINTHVIQFGMARPGGKGHHSDENGWQSMYIWLSDHLDSGEVLLISHWMGCLNTHLLTVTFNEKQLYSKLQLCFGM